MAASPGTEGSNFLAEGFRRAKDGLASRLTPKKGGVPEDLVLARAVTAGAVAGAYAGAVAGASAAAASVQRDRQGGASSPSSKTPTPASQALWQRTWDTTTGAWYYWHTVTRETTWTAPPDFVAPATPSTGAALDLSPTVTLGEYVDRSGFVDRTGGAATPQQQQRAAEPSLYAPDTDLEHEEEVDPRVGQALEEMNNAMTTVNSLEAALTQARRRARQLEAEQRSVCQEAYDKLSRGVKEVLPAYTRQMTAVQQQHRTQRAFVEYKQAHDAHLAAKAAVAELESRLMAASGGAQVDIQLLSQCSDLASRVVQTESAKLRADHIHAVEARRLSTLLLELKQGPRITKEHAERAQPYIEVKQRAEALLEESVGRIKLIEAQLADAKGAYSAAMARLDSISRDIHTRRQEAQAAPKDGAAAAEQANGPSVAAVESGRDAEPAPPRGTDTAPLQ